jgi:hypothetical protein
MNLEVEDILMKEYANNDKSNETSQRYFFINNKFFIHLKSKHIIYGWLRSNFKLLQLFFFKISFNFGAGKNDLQFGVGRFSMKKSKI